ncbi:hemin uptake protein HemP [Xinfangfangia sp. CPCC 101601]|uniref:Hemin uptake protein HemP n=1 Tax=Pseudogemmobacter lacusdianii TaxID=3069608 RepID=A0ABU0VY72_9RHOB|nr:hemin uptake protein HemP [Xinfangfangia sp. CPCC 101601]MDQ2066697.1 hemin uptake protein HemP [Xinfangfangia sp. CPCC 101601]
MDRPQAEAASPSALHAAAPKLFGTEPCHDARVLTGGGNSARILLGDQVYALRITKAGKLILTK